MATSPRDWMKINFDGAIFSAENKFRIGIVILDSSSLVIASCSQLLPQAYLASEVAKTLIFAQEVGVSRAILEGDSAVFMKALTCDDVSLASHRYLIEEVKFNSRFFFSITLLSC